LAGMGEAYTIEFVPSICTLKSAAGVKLTGLTGAGIMGCALLLLMPAGPNNIIIRKITKLNSVIIAFISIFCLIKNLFDKNSKHLIIINTSKLFFNVGIHRPLSVRVR
jgi:hypothetical protein